MSAVDLGMDHTRFDVPAFGETRIESLRRTSTDLLAPGQRGGAAALLAPPAAQPRSWVEDTSFDHFADLDLTDEPVPAAFTRTIERPETDEDTASRRAVGRRRGRSGDRRQWMALGAIAVVAAGAIGGVLMKYVFAGPSGPAHSGRRPGLGRRVHAFCHPRGADAREHAGAGRGQVERRVGQRRRVRRLRAGRRGPGQRRADLHVRGRQARQCRCQRLHHELRRSPIRTRTRCRPARSLGQAACTETHVDNEEAAMCVWFDNDTFGALVSPTMTTTQLAVDDGQRPAEPGALREVTSLVRPGPGCPSGVRAHLCLRCVALRRQRQPGGAGEGYQASGPPSSESLSSRRVGRVLIRRVSGILV